MSYRYETPTRQRLVLGASDATHRLCLPVDGALYDACVALIPVHQAQLLTLLPMLVREAVGALQEPPAPPEAYQRIVSTPAGQREEGRG